MSDDTRTAEVEIPAFAVRNALTRTADSWPRHRMKARLKRADRRDAIQRRSERT